MTYDAHHLFGIYYYDKGSSITSNHKRMYRIVTLYGTFGWRNKYDALKNQSYLKSKGFKVKLVKKEKTHYLYVKPERR